MQLKRILSMLLAAALIFSTSMVTVNAETVETIETFEVGVVAETTAPVSLSPAIYKSGDEVSVKISADQNTGITILKFSIKFDPNALEFVDYTSTNLFSNDIEGVYVYSDSVCYTLMMNNVSTATGEMLTLNFKVKEDFCGDVAIYAEVFDGQDKNCINGLNVVPFVGGRASFAAHAVDADAGVVTDPTCTEDGYTTYHCDICNENIKGNTLASLGHTSDEPVVENRIESTCTENGAYDSVVYCSVCDVELSREVITIDATGHTAGNAVEENRIAPTCTENGTYDSVVYCLVCNDELSRETITIDATGHDAANSVEENRVNPTCTEDGSYDSVVYCSVCNEELSRETITLNKLGHDIITHEAQSPTCTQVGWDAYDTCSRCDYTTYKEIHPLGHNPTITKEENRVEATCITDGSYDSVVYCSVCNEELSRENKLIKAPGHNLIHHDAKYATCTEIGWNAYETCRICDYTTYVEISALGHQYGTPTIVEPEYKKDGYTTHTCSVCNHEEKYDITPALTYILGDADGNETIDSDDAIYLLFHTLLPEEYAVNQKCDFDGDGDLDSDDAIYLLYHTLLLEKYPLHK